MDASLCLCSSDRCSDPTACPLPLPQSTVCASSLCSLSLSLNRLFRSRPSMGQISHSATEKKKNRAARGGVLQCGPCVCQATLQGKALRAGEKEALRSRRTTGWALLGKAVSRGEEPRSNIVAWVGGAGDVASAGGGERRCFRLVGVARTAATAGKRPHPTPRARRPSEPARRRAPPQPPPGLSFFSPLLSRRCAAARVGLTRIHG